METNATSIHSLSELALGNNMPSSSQIEHLVQSITHMSPWIVGFTILAVLVAYDQRVSIIVQKLERKVADLVRQSSTF